MISGPVLINNNKDRGFYVWGGKVVGICDLKCTCKNVFIIIVFLWLKLDVLSYGNTNNGAV